MLTRPILLFSLGFAALLQAQNKPAAKPDPDTLILTDGESLIGHFVRSTGATVTFKSDVLGEVSVPWSKIKELHSAQRYAIVEKNIKLSRRADVSKVPEGSISMADQTLAVEPGPGAAPQKIPIAEAAYVIDEPTFEKDLHHSPGFFQDWKGAITAGATQRCIHPRHSAGKLARPARPHPDRFQRVRRL